MKREPEQRARDQGMNHSFTPDDPQPRLRRHSARSEPPKIGSSDDALQRQEEGEGEGEGGG